MPIYEYACSSCGHRFDVKQKFSDEPVADCPECGSHVRRVLHPAGVIFKGSGWYINDSRKGNGTSSETSSTTSEPSSPDPKSSSTPKETVGAATTE